MIPRQAENKLKELLNHFPAVALLGPRQVGKTTLARNLTVNQKPEAFYVDLERPSHRAWLQDTETYLASRKGQMVILDEIQRMPELFQILRSLIDENKRAGVINGQYLLLGSASLELLKQSSESLAGRIAYLELCGFQASDLQNTENYSQQKLWLRGGYPDSYLAVNDAVSYEWRQSFIQSYLERDIPALGPRIPAETLRRFFTMLAYGQASILKISHIASALSLSAPTVQRYVDLMVDLLLVRTLRPWSGSIKKRYIKSPKVYVRDTGLVHALLQIKSMEDLLSNLIMGNSYEAFVIEHILNLVPDPKNACFYRTVSGAEIDLIIELDSKKRLAFEIKHSSSPQVSKGFYVGCEDVQATHRYVVYPGKERFSLPQQVEAIPVEQLAGLFKELQ